MGLRDGRSGMLEALHLPPEHLLGFPLELRPHEGSEVRGWYVLPDVYHVQLGADLSRERSAAARAARAASSEPSVARRILLGKSLILLPPPVFDLPL